MWEKKVACARRQEVFDYLVFRDTFCNKECMLVPVNIYISSDDDYGETVFF